MPLIPNPLLRSHQSHINQLKKDKAPAAPAINVVLPNDMLSYGQYHAPIHNHAPAPVPPAPVPLASSLLPPGAKPCPKQDITTFCTVHNLSKTILERLQNHKFTGMQAFRYIEEQHLTEMGFMFGEIVYLKEAIGEWSGSL
jgi:hypothetical protein